MPKKDFMHRFVLSLCNLFEGLFNYKNKLEKEYDKKLKEFSEKEMGKFLEKQGKGFLRSLEEQDLLPFATVPLGEELRTGITRQPDLTLNRLRKAPDWIPERSKSMNGANKQ